MDGRLKSKIDDISKIFNELNEVIEKQKNLEELWNVQLFDFKKTKSFFENFQKSFKDLKQNILRNKKICIFFGDTSSGKSTIINALLRKKYLPSSIGKTSRCLLKIKRISNSDGYVQINEEPRESINLLKSLNMKASISSIIKVYINCDNIPMFDENTIIFDSPGKDSTVENDITIDENNKNYMKNKILDICKSAHVRVLVVNANGWISDSTMRFIEQFKSHISKLNLFIVFTYMDDVHRNCKTDEKKNNKEGLLKEKAINLLKDKNRIVDSRDINNIYFLSPREHLEIIKGNNTNEPRYFQCRQNEFEKFLTALKREMDKNSYTRRIERLYQITSTLINSIKLLALEIESKLFVESKRIMVQMKLINEKQIEKIITDAKKDYFKEFIYEGILIFLEKKKTFENIQDPKLQFKLDNLLKDKNEEFIKKIKVNIKKLINTIEDPYNSRLMLIMENIFYPSYLNKLIIAQANWKENLWKIAKIIKVGTIAAEFLAAIITKMICAATKKVLPPLLKNPLTTTVEVNREKMVFERQPSFQSYLIKKINKLSRPLWLKQENEIEVNWTEFVYKFMKKYQLCLTNMKLNLYFFNGDLIMDIANIQKKFDIIFKNNED